MIVMGADPGRNGALAWMDSEDNEVTVVSMPRDVPSLWDVMEDFRTEPTHVALEKVASMPGQGVRSMFTFGQWYGRLEACLVAAGASVELVTPRKWQQTLGCMSGGDKGVTYERARLLYPRVKFNKKQADAVCLMEYCRRIILGK